MSSFIYKHRSMAVVTVLGAIAVGCGSDDQPGEEASSRSPAVPAGKGGPESSTSRLEQKQTGGGASQSIEQSQTSDGSSSSSSQSSSGTSVQQSSSQTSSGGVDLKTFAGTGRQTLSFNVAQPSRLVWTEKEGRSFSVEGGGITIDSSEGRGEVPLEPGNYRDVVVTGQSWTITVRTR